MSKKGKRTAKTSKAKSPRSQARQPEKAKKKSSTKGEMRRFVRRPPPDGVRRAFATRGGFEDEYPIAVPGTCRPAIELLNNALNEGCALRSEFVIEAQRGCVAGEEPGSALVDLVILIDTSGSMGDEATALSDAAGAAIQAAQGSCPSDVRVCWFGIEATWPDTRFTQSYRDYLQGQVTENPGDCRYTGTPVPDSDIRGYPGDREEGAAAIMDIAEHFDWRPGAARAVFFLGDEALERGGVQDANDYAAADAAIAVAQQHGITVFTYFGTPIYPQTAAETSSEYRRVATDTGGQFYSAPADNLGGFQAILEQIICASSGGGCQEAQLPRPRPCFRLMWGDGPDDRIETDDVELMCIQAVNPYTNIAFKDLTLLVSLITEEDGSDVEMLPDGTRSVYLKPFYVVCFGDIPPCDPEAPGGNAVSREIVLVSRGAKQGRYRVYLAYCYSISVTYLDLDWYELELVKS